MPSGKRRWKRLPRITTPGTATPRFAHSSATRKRTAGPARPSSSAPRDSTDHWAMAERDGLACLLLPASEEELRRAVALVDRAVATGPKFFPANAYILFIRGLAEYRQGRPQQAVPLLRRVGGTPRQPRRSAVGAGHGPVPDPAARRKHGRHWRPPSGPTTGWSLRRTTPRRGSATCSAARPRR